MHSRDLPRPTLEPRAPFRERGLSVAWIGWAVAVALLTVGPLLWHLGYFAKTGRYIGPAIVGALAALSFLAWAYHQFCPPALRGRELRLLGGLALVATLVQEPRATMVVCALAASCFAVGSAAIAKLGIAMRSVTERLAFAVAVGLGGWIVVLIPVGLAGLYGPRLFALMLAATLVLFRSRLADLASDLRSLDAAWREIALERSPLTAAVVAFLPAFAVAFWVAAMAPATATDPIAFHMPAARHYLASGELAPLPIIPGAYEPGHRLFSLGHSAAYSFYPQSFEELLTISWALGGQPAAQLISPLFTVLTVLMATAIGRRCGLSRAAALVGAAAAFTIPVVSWSGAIAKNDSMLACFELAALHAVITARSDTPRRRLLLAAFFLGLSLGVKHVAIYGAIPITILMLDRLRRQSSPLRLGPRHHRCCRRGRSQLACAYLASDWESVVSG